MKTNLRHEPGFAMPAGSGYRPALAWNLALLVLGAGTLFEPLAIALEGDGFVLTGQVGSGGGLSTGGGYVLEGALVLPTGAISTGGSYLLAGGLGPGEPGASQPIKFRAVLTPSKDAELSWEGDMAGYVLEFSPSLGPDANWQPVVPQPTGNSFLTPCAQPARFFCLRELGP